MEAASPCWFVPEILAWKLKEGGGRGGMNWRS